MNVIRRPIHKACRQNTLLSWNGFSKANGISKPFFLFIAFLLLGSTFICQAQVAFDEKNPSGYAQVLQEWSEGSDAKALYTYGLGLISQRRDSAEPYNDRWSVETPGSGTYQVQANGTPVHGITNYEYAGDSVDEVPPEEGVDWEMDAGTQVPTVRMAGNEGSASPSRSKPCARVG